MSRLSGAVDRVFVDAAKRVPCRMCRARVARPCVQAGPGDRPDSFRKWNPHRLRLVDAGLAWRRGS